MTKEEERQAFLAAIKDDPADLTNRLVFADWLEENGEDDEAEFCRHWDIHKYQEAEEFLRYFASEVEMEYNRLLSAAERYLRTGDDVTLGFDTPDVCYAEMDRFWESYHIVTNVKKDEDAWGGFFNCSC